MAVQETYRSIWLKALISMLPWTLREALFDKKLSFTMQHILAKANFAVLLKYLSHAKNVTINYFNFTNFINDILFSHIWHESTTIPKVPTFKPRLLHNWLNVNGSVKLSSTLLYMPTFHVDWLLNL